MDPELVRVFRLSMLAVITLAGQTPDVFTIGPGITAPTLLHKVEPKYSPMARADHVQGTVVYETVIDVNGRATETTVISPLGFGLEEQGLEAIEKWRFKPGQKNGEPVKIRATIEVNFRFPAIWFDEKEEKHRTAYNLALANIKEQEAKEQEAKRRAPAVKSIKDLAQQSFPPAMYLLGVWETGGVNVDQNLAEGWSLLQKSADKNYGPALYEVAHRQLEGKPPPDDAQKALETMRQASVLGSVQAQYFLGHAYEKGIGVEADTGRARRYFRLCATRGVAQCQARLANLMLHQPGVPEYNYEQAVAWLQIAADQGLPDAIQVAAQEEAKLTPAQLKSVAQWKARLPPKQ
jgi:TonB family protein